MCWSARQLFHPKMPQLLTNKNCSIQQNSTFDKGSAQDIEVLGLARGRHVLIFQVLPTAYMRTKFVHYIVGRFYHTLMI